MKLTIVVRFLSHLAVFLLIIFIMSTVVWAQNAQYVKGRITGTVLYHKNMHYNGLKDRDIIVWLPESYKKDVKKRYPVIYMHDGQNIVDPATSYTGYDWRVDEVTDSLIKAGEMKEVIVVGIYNTSDRFEEYSNTPKGKSYREFVITKVKPFIDSVYRTLKDARYTSTMGSSMGGLVSFMIAWEYPQVISMAGCFSPALTIPKGEITGAGQDYVPFVKKYNGSKKSNKFYIDNGGRGVDTILITGVESMITELKNKGYKENEDLLVFIDKKADHNEIAWAERVWRPLKFFYGKTKVR